MTQSFNSWSDVLSLAAEIYSNKNDEAELSDQLGGCVVSLAGTVMEIDLTSDIASPFIRIRLGENGVFLKSRPKRLIKSRSIPLMLDEESIATFALSKTKIGDEIKLTAKISKGNGPFRAVSVADYEDEPAVFLQTAITELTSFEVIANQD